MPDARPGRASSLRRGLVRSFPFLQRAALVLVIGRLPEIQDDLGRPIVPHHVRTHFITGKDMDVILSDADMKELHAATRRSQSKRRALVCVCLIAFLVGIPSNSIIRGFPSFISIYVLVSVLLFCYFGIKTLLGHYFRSEDLLAMLRKWDRCLACAHPLEHIPVAPSGCRICPECGAAWNVQQAQP